MRIATWNVLHGLDVRSSQVSLEATVDAVGALDADVVALQEVDRRQGRSGERDQTRDIAAALGYRWRFGAALLGDPATTWTTAERDDGSQAAYGVALLSRHPFAAAVTHRLPGGGAGRRRRPAVPGNPGWDREPRIALAAEIVVDRTPVAVTTTHLSYLPWRGVRQLRAVARSALAAQGPSVVLGDFNLPPWTVRAVTGRSWRSAGGDATYPSWRPRLQLDQLLVAGRVEVAAVRAGAPGPSDHLPLIAELSIG